MKWREWLEKWSMTSLKVQTPFLEMEWAPGPSDQSAAWELYIELLTRIATQPLASGHGTETSALASIHSLFGITRETLKKNGSGAKEFAKIAIIVLNQIIRPFTSKWHPVLSSSTTLEDTTREEFRLELAELQAKLTNYTAMLADMANVEDLTSLEDTDF